MSSGSLCAASTSGPQIHAVVEVEVDKVGLWVDLPADPWPRFVRLCSASTDEEIALLVSTLCCYGRGEAPSARSPAELVKTFPIVLPGGLAVVDGVRAIYPGCCCGLEDWSGWLEVAASGQPPWTGHDPAPLIDVTAGQVQVWSDGALGGTRPAESTVVFTLEQFDSAVRNAALDLQGFMEPLRAWLGAHAPRHAKVLANKFRNKFVLDRRRHTNR